MASYDSYVICTSPRSGSTLLCRLLSATGVAGSPESYFHASSVEGWLRDLDLTPAAGTSERERLKAVFQAAMRQGRAGSSIFGLRLQRQSCGLLFEKLAFLYPEATTDAARIERAFGSTLFIHLTRPDKLAQSVSYLKAEQSGLWHVAPDGSELERLSPHREPVYDQMAIRSCVVMMEEHDRQWLAWFEEQAVSPLRISYDALSADPVGTVRRLLLGLGLDDSAADVVKPGVRKLADAVNRDWIERYKAETLPA